MKNIIKLKIALTVMLWVMAGFAPVTSMGQPSVPGLTEPGKAFKEYQAEAPPIKRIVFEQTYSNGKYGPGIVWADGAIQPGGFFIRHLTNSPYTSGILVKGTSMDKDWEYFPENKVICFGPPTVWSNANNTMNTPMLGILQRVARLGLFRPFPDHDGFVWTSQTEFKFSPPDGDFVGSIVRFDDHSRPVELEYHSAQKNSKFFERCLVTYGYDSGQDFPPSRFVVDLTTPDMHSVTTNILHTLTLGLDEHAKRGYSLQEFLPKDANITTVYCISNHVRYDLLSDGTLREYKHNDPTQQTTHSRRHTLLYVIGALSMLGVASLFYHQKRA